MASIDLSTTSECESGDIDLDIQPLIADLEDKQVVIVTAGKSGVGKTTLINTFLGLEGDDMFKADGGPKSVTKCVGHCDTAINGVDVRMINMPGFHAIDSGDKTDTETEGKRTKRKEIIADLKILTKNGVDVVFHCINLSNRLDEIDYKNLDTLIQAFGEGIWDHIIFVFTHTDLVPTITRQKEWIEESIKLLQKRQRKRNVEIRSIFSFTNQDIKEYIDFNGIVGIPVSKYPANPENWKDTLLVEIIRKIRKEKLPIVLKLKYMYINWYEAKKTLTITAKCGAKGATVGGGVGGVIGAIVGGVVTAPAGGTGALGAAAAGAAIGAWIGTIGGAGSIGLSALGTRIAYVIQSRLKLQKQAKDRLAQGGSAASQDEDQTDASQDKKCCSLQ